MREQDTKLKNINRRSVLNYIRKNRSATKAGLASATGLTFAAIKKILDELESLDLVRFSSIEKKNIGRNSVMYEINPNYDYIISIFINRKAITVAVVDLGRTIRSKRILPMENRTLTQSELIEMLLHAAWEVVTESGISRSKFAGVGIGAPGPIDLEKGIILTPPNMPILHYLPMKDILESKLELPVHLHKDTNVLALGEYWSDSHRIPEDLLYLDLDMGIGSGFVINGNIRAGANGKAGEFGHITLDVDGPLCKCGNRGCMEAMASGIAIVRDFSEALDHEPTNPMYPIRQSLTIDDVLQAVRNNDMTAISIINHSAYLMGIGVANIVNVLDPERVVLGGLLVRDIPNSFDIITDVARQHILKRGSRSTIEKSRLGMDAGVVGCAEVVIDDFFRNTIDELWLKSSDI